MDREELEKSIMWNKANAVIPSIVGKPKEWPSVAALMLPKERYTDEELKQFVDFAHAATAHDDTIPGRRTPENCHLMVIEKQKDGTFTAHRLGTEATRLAKTMEEAIDWCLKRCGAKSAG